MTVNNRALSYRLWVTTLFCVVAFALCSIMISHSLNGSEINGCIAGSSCDSVLNSKWSLIFDIIPVSAIALGVYLVIIICCIYLNLSNDYETRDLAWKILLILTGAIIGSAIWFSVIQIWIIEKLCPYCISTHFLGILISTLIIVSYFHENKTKNTFFICSAAGFILALIMATTQFLTTNKSNFATGYINEELPQINIEEAPIIGDPNAKYIVTLMFDYQCSHCRTIHSVINQTVEKYNGQLAFLLCPTPLSPACNKYLPMTEKDLFAGSCDLAKIALAVWRYDKNSFYRFDSWLFENKDSHTGWYPRTVEEAKFEAERLIGAEALDKSLSDFWISDYMKLCFNLFGRTTNNSSSGIPRLIYGSKWLIPEAVNADELSEILKTAFNISE